MEEIVVGDAQHPMALGCIEAEGLSRSQQWELFEAVKKLAKIVELPLEENPIGREADFPGQRLAAITASGVDLVNEVPWLEGFYENNVIGQFRRRMNRPMLPIQDFNDAIIGNVLFEGMRFETHVDNWPYNANLYLQTNPGADLVQSIFYRGGALVLGNNPDAKTHLEVLLDVAARIPPIEGTYSFVVAQHIAHTIEAIGLWEGWEYPPEGPERALFVQEMIDAYRVVPFQIPDLSDETLWNEARVSINFAGTNHQHNRRIAQGLTQAGVAERTLGIELTATP